MFEEKSCDKIIFRCHKHNNLYLLEDTTICGKVNTTRFQIKMSHMWHSRS